MRETFQLSGNAAAIYEEQKVPAIFGPLAEATLDAVPLFESDSVLDIACGTGIVARKARARVGPSARIAGVDLNQGMIDAARNLTDADSRSCEWHAADVTKLPFEDGTFTVAFCQQGLQFFPDPELALREIGRVLRPGGRIALTVWSEASALFVALAESFRRHVSDEIAESSLAPFVSPGAGAVGALGDHVIGGGADSWRHGAGRGTASPTWRNRIDAAHGGWQPPVDVVVRGWAVAPVVDTAAEVETITETAQGPIRDPITEMIRDPITEMTRDPITEMTRDRLGVRTNATRNRRQRNNLSEKILF